jgi:predicted RNA polymerase sigma factor
LHRVDLTAEAIRLTRQLHQLMPDDPEVGGLLALILLIDARRPARTRPDGSLVPLAEQDRRKWNHQAITEGIELITRTLPRGRVGSYQLQAAIAAVHDEAADAKDTDWPQILALYELLEQIAPSPTVTLNRAVAVAMVQGPQAGLDLLHTLEADERLAGQHRLYAVRGHLLEMAGDLSDAQESYQTAARLTTSLPESRYLHDRITKLIDHE